MAKQLNVNLAFTADTSQAKAQLQALQTSLAQLTSTTAISKSGLGIDKEITSAIANVNKLKVALEQATNIKTGKLDLGMFDAQLKKSGLKLQDYAESLYALGPQGAQAFSQLTQSITTAEIPLRRSNTLLKEFATTLKNTARWQISSSILHGFMGAAQSAYGYAKDLNESLNNIRIVTGQNTDQMAKFAKEANAAAKALSATTTEYTNASLIYYQQGLSEQEVKDRANITIKMANVTGESAETVSDQLTAVWNNFYDGSKSLEYYVDVMTALGAATASSTDEITEGLEKFAAVSNTVGLSYEYATSALATVTATTRESASVVGTAFKTLFARIQGLSLGETLDDGTTLNKYSEALNKVGISIFDQYGQMKAMDDILNEMGAKWGQLEKDQQTALAQTVAGVRQYTQLVALMDNWDFFKENLGVAKGSEGALQSQADIYAESWQAAADRVKASLETIYSQLLNDEFFIDLNDGLANVLDTVSDLIDKAGGLKGVLLVLSTVMLRTFGASLSKEIERIAFNMTLMGKKASQVSETLRNDANKALKSYTDDKTIVGSAQYGITQKQASLQDSLIAKNKELLRIGKQITEEEQKHVAQMLDLNRAIGEQVTKTAQAREEEEKITKALISQATQKIVNPDTRNKIKTDLTNAAGQQSQYVMGDLISTDLQKMAKNGATLDDLKRRLAQFVEEAKKAHIDISFLDKALQSIDGSDIKDAQEAANAFEGVIQDLGADAQIAFDNISNEAEQAHIDIAKLIEKIQQSASNGGKLTKEQTELLQRFGLQVKQTGETIEGLRGRAYTAADGFVALGSTISQVVMTVTIFKSTLDTFNSEDATWLDKLTSGAMLLGTVISTLTFVLGKSNREQLAAIPISLAAALGFKAEEVAAKGATTGVISLGAALKFLATNPYVWAITAIIAGIAAVCISLYQSTHKAQKAFKTLEKGAKDAATSMQEIKTEVEGLSSALDSLSEKTKALDDLTYGTSQWASAMADVNEEVLDLIDNYNLNEFNADGLANYYRDDRGVMHLTDAGRLEILNKAEAKVESTTKAMNATEYARNKGEAAAKRESLINSSYTGKISNQYSSGSVSSGVNGVSSYSSWTSNTPYETILSAKGIDDTVQALQQGLISKDLLGDTSALIAAGVSQAQAELISSNKFLQDEIYNLSIITKENTEAYEAKVANELINNDAVYKSIYGTTNSEGQQVGGIDEKYRDSAMNQISKDIIKLEEQYLKNIKPEKIEEQRNEYAKSFDYGEKDGKYYKKDEHGNILTDEEVTISDDAVKQWIAHNKAIETATKNVDKYTEAVEISNKVWESAAKLKEKTGEEELSLWEKTKNAVNKYKDNFSAMDEESWQIVQETQNHLQQLLRINDDVVKDILTPEFIQENSSLIEDAINGDIEALNALSTKAAEGISIETIINTSGEELTAEVKEMLAEVDSQIDDIEIGASLNDTEVVKTLNSMLEKGQITSEQMQEYLGLKGFKGVKVGLKEVTRRITLFEKLQSFFTGKGWPAADSETYQVPYIMGSDQTQSDYNSGGNTRSSQPFSTSPILKPKDPSKIIDTEANSPRGGNENNGNKYKPEKDAYHEITKEIEKQERALKRLQKAKENAFGKNKLDAIDNEIKSIKGLMTAHEELFRQQNEQLNIDAGKLLQLFPEADITNGYIANYNDLLMKTISEDQKKILDNYEKTWEAMEQTQDDLIAFDQQIKDLNYDKISYQLELKIDINESELELLDLYLKEYEDSFYKMAESLTKMRDQGDIYSTMLGDYYDTWQTLKKQYSDKNIDQEKYIEGLETVRDGIYGQLEALIDLDKEMMNFYGDTLEAADEELESYTSHMEHLTSVFDYYLDLMDILGKSKDYDTLGDFLQGKADTLKDQLDVQKEWLNNLKEQRENIEADLREARAAGNEEEIELLEKQWKEIVEKVDEAQDEVLALTTEWIEAMKAVIENNMEQIADTLEKSLTDGIGFDALMDNFDKLNTRQEEYLTKTNQIYETNKLMRTANKALDETDNKVAKQKLQNFINETKSLQENNKLSKYELEIQQAKYDLLLAEIALEEAQNAKSTVRLSRDNEGNFGYIYTADENKIADAEQAVDDKKNSLYNLSLKGQQEYTEKYLQAQQEMFNELKELQDAYLSGEIASEEEYRNRQQEIVNHYYGENGVLTTYSKLYNIAVQTDAKATADYWGDQYGDMTQDTKKWKKDVDQYLLDIQEQTSNWRDVSTQANDVVEGALKDSKDATKDLTDESENLKDMIKDEVLPAVNDELIKVGELTKAYGEQRTELQLLITKYSGYITKLNEAITAASRLASVGGDVETPAPVVNVKPTTPIFSEGGEVVTEFENGDETDDNDNNIETKPKVPNFKEEKMEDDIKNTNPVPPSTFNEGQRLKTKEKFGFISRYTKRNDTMVENGSWGPAIGGGIKLNEITDKYYYNGQWYYHVKGGGAMGWASGWIKGLQAEAYNTGGYTGAWGPEGKMAILHQKELVLNAQDTENMLGIIMAVREIMNSIDKQAAWASSGLGMLTAAGYNSMSQNLEQTVTIHAEFPNATNHSEIEEAFNTLINRASQYANRK